MKHKTAELSGEMLNLAVHKAREAAGYETLTAGLPELIAYSTSWGLAGLIIERECIDIAAPNEFDDDERWFAGIYRDHTRHKAPRNCEMRGETPLIAAMRSFVASRLGEDVEL